MAHVAERAPEGWKSQHESQMGTTNPEDFETFENTDLSDDSPDACAYRKAWVQRFDEVDIANPRLCAKHKTQGTIVVEGLRNRPYGLARLHG